MLTTTEDWKTALGCINVPYREYLVPENNIKIEYEQIDTSAQNNATVTVNSNAPFSDHTEVMDLSIDWTRQTPVATLEPNEWVLDGTTVNYGTDTHAGWVSAVMSKSDGTFDTNPILTLTWSSTQTTKIGGISVWFSSLLGEWATQFKVTAKLGSTITFQQTYTNDQVTDYFYGELSGYNTLIIEIIKWCLPYRRARIENICMGLTYYIGKSDVLSMEQGMSSDLLSFTLPDDYFTFEIDNVDEKWNPDNPSGIYEYLTERQRVNVRYAFNIDGVYEWHLVGTYFMSEWTTPQNGISASFTARSLIDFMTKKFSPSSISGYTFGNSITLKALAEAAFTQANLPIDADGTSKWSIANELASISVVIPYTTEEGTNKWDFDYTCAEVIQLCANASCAVIRPNEEGDICIVMPSTTVGDYYIDQFVSYSNGEYDISKALKTININEGDYVYTPSGSVSTGEEQSIKNSLVQSSSQQLATSIWASDLLLKRKSINGEFRADPRLQPLDVITNVNKYAMNQVYITDVTWTYSGAFKGAYEGRVLKSIPLADREGEYYVGDYYSKEFGGE